MERVFGGHGFREKQLHASLKSQTISCWENTKFLIMTIDVIEISVKANKALNLIKAVTG